MRRVGLIGVLSLAALGCANDDGGPKPSADAGTSSGPLDGSQTGIISGDGSTATPADGAINAGLDSGGAPRDGGVPSSCASPNVIADTSCSAAEIMSFNQCVETACKSKYQECYGAGYQQGAFGGPCADYLECGSKCACGDTTCSTACQASAACSTCQSGFSACASPCLGQLSCATRGLTDASTLVPDAGIVLPDAGLDLTKTCADLLACCGRVSDASQKTACMQVHASLSGAGSGADLSCSAVISTYCP